MEIGAVPQVQQNALPGAKADAAPVPKSSVDKTPVKVPQVENVDLKRAEEQRMAALKKAISNSRDLFAVRDTSFTIFKDAKGQFVTRFTSLRDGSVTYYPEPEIVRKLHQSGFDTASIGLDV